MSCRRRRPSPVSRAAAGFLRSHRRRHVSRTRQRSREHSSQCCRRGAKRCGLFRRALAPPKA
jgi:hypothetical protein